jgi:hypothetical protein
MHFLNRLTNEREGMSVKRRHKSFDKCLKQRAHKKPVKHTKFFCERVLQNDP